MKKLFVLILVCLAASMQSANAKVNCEDYKGPVESIQKRLDTLFDRSERLDDMLISLAGRSNTRSVMKKRKRIERLLKKVELKERFLLAKLEKANEKVAMCKTHNIKYPLAIKIAQNIGKVGCADYEPREYTDAFKMDAQMEIFDAVCAKK